MEKEPRPAPPVEGPLPPPPSMVSLPGPPEIVSRLSPPARLSAPPLPKSDCDGGSAGASGQGGVGPPSTSESEICWLPFPVSDWKKKYSQPVTVSLPWG